MVINGHRNQAAIEGVAEEARSLGVRAIAMLADVGDPAAVQTMVDRAAEELGSVDILVSNVSTRLHTKFLDISIEEWQRILNSNLSASFYLARAALPLMKARSWGRIIHISGRDGFAVIPHTCRRNVRGDVRWRG